MRCKNCALCNDCQSVAESNHQSFDLERGCCRNFAPLPVKYKPIRGERVDSLDETATVEDYP